MKKIIIICSMFAFMGCLTSCDEFLKEDPKGLVVDSYTLTELGIEQLILSLYNNNRNIMDPMLYFADAGTDVFTWSANGGAIQDNAEYVDGRMINSTANRNYWRYLYEGLNIANNAIHTLPDATVSSEDKRGLLWSEAHALRAWNMFLIVETWGPASHFTNTPSQSVITEINQSGIGTFFKQILEDLDIADQNLKSPRDKDAKWGRMNIGVAKMLRMRVLMALAAYDDAIISQTPYTKQQCYEKSIELCNSLISDYGYQLLDSYSAVFDVNNQLNNEIIWSVQFTSDMKYNGTGNALDAAGLKDEAARGGANYLHRYFVPWYNKTASDGGNVSVAGLFSHSVYYGREYRHHMPTLYYIQCFNQYDKRLNETFQSVWCRLPTDKSAPVLTDTCMIRSLKVETAAKKAAYRARGIYLDDLADVYNMTTGDVTTIGRSCYNTMVKYLDQSRDEAKRETGFKDITLMRLGEVYITLAEAYVRTGQTDKAAQAITDLRKRALTPGHEAELAVSASDMTLDFVLEEGARELGCELNRWYMLKRSGKLVEWVKARNPDAARNPGAQDQLRIKDYHIYRPLPQTALYEVTNDIKQNNGYPQ